MPHAMGTTPADPACCRFYDHRNHPLHRIDPTRPNGASPVSLGNAPGLRPVEGRPNGERDPNCVHLGAEPIRQPGQQPEQRLASIVPAEAGFPTIPKARHGIPTFDHVDAKRPCYLAALSVSPKGPSYGTDPSPSSRSRRTSPVIPAR